MFRPLLRVLFALVPFTALADSVEEARAAFIAGDHEAAAVRLKPFAEAGDPLAQNMLGLASYSGLGVPQDCVLALDWLEKSAAQEHPRGLYNLARYRDDGCYGEGLDPAGAEGLYRKAVEAGVVEANAFLARLLASGRASPPEDSEVLALLSAAEAQGNLFASVVRADLLAQGTFAPAEPEAAAQLYRLAIDAGRVTDAYLGLARLEAAGIDGDPNPAAARALLETDWDLGDARAGAALAELLKGTDEESLGWAMCLVATRRAGPTHAPRIAAACDAVKEGLSAEALQGGETLATFLR